MKIFISYPSEERDAAEQLNLALLQQGSDVFFDRDDLPPGLEYDQAIANFIAQSDLIVFLITPASVTAGRYTLTEVKLAQERWPEPQGRVLPVMMRPTDMATIPPYLRAVNLLIPRGNAVAETAHEVRRLTRALGLTTRFSRAVRSPGGIVAALGIVAVSAFALIARPRERGLLGPRTVRLPAAVRQHARAVAPLVDSGFVVATSNPAQLVRFSEGGVQIGEPIDLMGDPISVTRTPQHLLVVTRARDGIMAFEAKKLRVTDSTILDPALVKPPYRSVNPPRRSGDIQSVAVGSRGDLWVTTGDRDGTPTVLRFRNLDHVWDVPTFTVDTAGFGPDANGVRLRDLRGEMWGVRRRGDPSVLYHFVGFIRIDRFDGRDLKLVSCAHDVASTPSLNVLFLSCDNELQEVSVEGKQLTVVRTRPTLPPDRTPGTSSYDLIEMDSTTAVVALNTVATPNDKPLRARIVEVDSAGITKSLLDERDAVVQSMGVTPTSVVAVVRRADGSTDALVVPRKR